MRFGLTVFILAFVFAIGLGWSGMTDPQRVLGFLDIAGNFDPSLVFVMGSAIPVYYIFWRLVQRTHKPLWDVRLHVPTRRDIDSRLIMGSAIFGIGWGVAGICPGPGIAGLGALSLSAFIFVLAFFVGGKIESIVVSLFERALRGPMLKRSEAGLTDKVPEHAIKSLDPEKSQ